MGPEGSRPGRPTQTVRHRCSGKLGIVKILRYIRSDMYAAFFWREDAPGQRGPVLKAHLCTMVNPTLILGLHISTNKVILRDFLKFDIDDFSTILPQLCSFFQICKFSNGNL